MENGREKIKLGEKYYKVSMKGMDKSKNTALKNTNSYHKKAVSRIFDTAFYIL